MNKAIKTIAKQLPGIKALVAKNQSLIEQLEKTQHQAVQIARESIDLRLKLKKLNKEKINVVFICHRPAVWESLHSVYDSIKADDSFNTYIVAIPNKKELPRSGLNHEIYESEGAEEFWKSYGCINGYDYETNEWFDFRTLKPDYVFFQQPYNITRCEEYKSWNVALYAKICYVPYAFDFIGHGILEETSPRNFMHDVSIYFTQNTIDHELVSKMLQKYGFDTRTVLSGFPRYDDLEKYRNNHSESWRFSNSKQYKIMWTPRWCTNEGNCNFFEYKDRIVNYALENDDVALLFRPHPQAFSNWISTGELSEGEADAYKLKYSQSNNMRIDSKQDYFDTIFESDCLISDASSFIADYFMTGKPVIYCHRKDTFNAVSKEMSRAFYWVENWNELEDTINSLKQGGDVLKHERERLLEKIFNNKQNAGEFISNYLKNQM